MKIHIVVSLLLAAVLNGVESSWTIITGDNGAVEIIDENQTPAQSASTLSELRETVNFYLYTSSNPQVSQQLYFGDADTLSASNFDAKNPTRMVIHGWMSSSAKPVATETRDAYLSRGDYNIIAVDWSSITDKNYITARSKMVAVGEYIGLFIDFLTVIGEMNIDDLIIIGHSLGAHVSGVASRSAIHTAPILIALDPAGPLFYHVITEAKLKSSDADFVQVIHTNTGMMGCGETLGDVDLWPNGGNWQPGCNFDVVGVCSHQRSYYYLIESIINTEKRFVARKCENYSDYTDGKCDSNESTYLGGLDIDTNAEPGAYYLTTNSVPTYAQG